jgi:hypothetical protein
MERSDKWGERGVFTCLRVSPATGGQEMGAPAQVGLCP